MGNGSLGSAHVGKTRYMGGKTYQKFYTEDIWPLVEDTFYRLHISEGKGFHMFRKFADIDANENGRVDTNECFKVLGGKRTKFSERLFYSQETKDLSKNGLTFTEFSIALWQYCTLSPHGLARYVFEIFDIENHFILARADVRAIFRMLYDCDHASVDEEIISLYSYNEEGKLHKEHFIEVSGQNPLLIRPALDYQRVLRKATGGISAWESLTIYREKKFSVYDEQSDTLSESLDSIIRSAADFAPRYKAQSSEKLLAEKSAKIKKETELIQRELVLRERQLENEKKLGEKTAPDRHMKRAWALYERARAVFDAEEFTTEDLWRRREARDALYELIDRAVESSKEYWIYKDQKDYADTEGSELDHEARYQDFVTTEQGQKLKKFTETFKILSILLKEIDEKNAKNRRYNPNKKSEKHVIIESNLNQMKKVMDFVREEVSHEEREKRMKQLTKRDMTEEMSYATKFGSKKDFQQAEKEAHDEMCADLKKKTLRDCRDLIAKAALDREKDYQRRVFEVAMNLGSRITRWEYVLEKVSNKYVYINVDTLEWKHPKTAICEHCDAILVQHEMTCDGCAMPRSQKNQRLFRPLGFKDITLE